ncbi:baseplate J/gp47 family protein [Sansalvadorimonas verongulae]|uniref:baseplate J/gp47 family protein n=1 Tax=Sansalvadorimonas verongulae TaxID=2172824 RepID=UPI0012BBA120|nr:baseplate J/gp47 family protein [Sansalvadorimonas verongulae]MTI13371.1 baseplate J/gp47 family protein [Sansalvadorimonas verongulae]
MPFQRPSLKNIIDRTTADLDSRMGGVSFRRAVKTVLARALAGVAHGLYGYLDYLARQINPATAEGYFLHLWCQVWKVIPREAQTAKGQVTFTGNTGASIATGTLLVRSDGAQLRVTTGATLASGTALVDVEALEAGASANTETGVIVQLQKPVEGVLADATVAGTGITGGENAEDDESLRTRLLLRIQKPPKGGNKDDYERWTLEVPGTYKAWCYPNRMGLGTVSVTFTSNDPDNPIPDAALVTAVTEHIDIRRPVSMKERYIYAPNPAPQTIVIANLQPDTPEVRAAVTEELKDLFYRIAQPEDGKGAGMIPVSQIRESISVALGENDHTLISPTVNIEPAVGELATFGGVTWQTA